MEIKTETKRFGSDYWDRIAEQPGVKNREEAWRAHQKEVYRRLKDRWTGEGRRGRTLKTDLYDEAVSPHDLISLFGSECDCVVGTDVSLEIARAARQRMAQAWAVRCQVAVSDVRHQAFKSHVFDQILSNSTLDHFPDRADIVASLEELRRILKPGGTLIITLDNPWNPVVWVRNRLPYRVLKRVGVIPYYMGVTLSRPELIRALESSGFRVCGSTAVVHSPRILAILTVRILAGRGGIRIRSCLQRLLWAFERLEGFPTKYVTGYYVAVRAVRIEDQGIIRTEEPTAQADADTP
jgi:SAM-dependent methyltransferase